MSNLSNIPVTLKFDFNQFLLFFEQLSAEQKQLILQSLEKHVTKIKEDGEKWGNLKGSVLYYERPFESVASEDWEVLQ